MKRYKDCALKCIDNQLPLELLCKVEKLCVLKGYETTKHRTWIENDTLLVLMEKDNMPLSVLFIVASKDEKKIIVSNIIPDKKSGLSLLEYSIYNKILDTFKNDIFYEINSEDGNIIEENQEDYTIQEIIPKSYEKLNIWLNAFPLSGHPFDEYRWFDFLISLRKNDENLSVDDFSKYIQENYNWSKKDIERFGLKYEEQIELLEYYDEHR